MSDANASNSKITAMAILLGLSWAVGLCTIASAQGPTCTAPPIDRTRSLVVTDAALDKTKFAFSRTIDAILGSLSIPKTAENRENFVKSLLTSFQDDDMVNPVSGLRMSVDLRPLEAGLDPKKLLNPTDPAGLVPVALFNRLDAAPADWSNCGEHRIIYSFKAAHSKCRRATKPYDSNFRGSNGQCKSAKIRLRGLPSNCKFLAESSRRERSGQAGRTARTILLHGYRWRLRAGCASQELWWTPWSGSGQHFCERGPERRRNGNCANGSSSTRANRRLPVSSPSLSRTTRWLSSISMAMGAALTLQRMPRLKRLSAGNSRTSSWALL